MHFEDVTMKLIIMLASMASAMPSPPSDDTPAPSDSSLEARTKYNRWDNYGDHPGSTSSFKDGEGTYVESGDNTERWTIWDTKCWTELYWVRHEVVAENWERDEVSVDCGTTSSCEIRTVKSAERCNSWENNFTLTLAAGTESFKKFMALAGEVSYEHVTAEERCAVSEAQGACVWDDKQCHQAWRSDLSIKHHGYIRRRCGKNVKDDHTVWMKDWTWSVPIKVTRLGCAALCSDMSYPVSAVPPVKM